MIINDKFCLEYSNIYNDEYDKLTKIKEIIYKKDKMLDWVDIDTTISQSELEKIINIGTKIKKECDVFLVIGIGGSYLGSKALIDALSPYFKKSEPEIIFLGYNLSSKYLNDVLRYIKDKNIYVNVISKSGTTLETKVTFEVIYNYLKENDPNYKEKIIVTTSDNSNTLKELATKENFETLKVPENIGGRFSVLSVVGLLPIFVAGIDINELLKGAKDNYNCFEEASKLAIIRNHLELSGKTIEAVTYYEEKLNGFALWYQQLFAETECKNKKGILPIVNPNTTNLHSLGQYLQEGRDQVFETVLKIEKVNETNLYYKDKKIDELNNIVLEQVAKAHYDGNTPSIIIEIPKLNAYYLGKLIYFFEMCTAIGAYLNDVYTFEQPGVEKYKKNVRSVLV